MKPAYIILGLLVVGGLVLFFISKQNMNTNTEENPAVVVMPVEHATLGLRIGETVVYVDPTGGAEAFKEMPPADIVLITDIHGDHLSPETLAAVIGDAELIVPKTVKDQLGDMASRAKVLDNGDSTKEAGVTITAIPMYNLPESPDAFHVKGRGNGYVVEMNGTRVYIAGDTGDIPEMRELTEIDIAFVPMNLPYTMTVEKAADAVLAFNPKVVYPYHYRNQDGTQADVAKFKDLVNAGNPDIQVVLAKWY